MNTREVALIVFLTTVCVVIASMLYSLWPVTKSLKAYSADFYWGLMTGQCYQLGVDTCHLPVIPLDKFKDSQMIQQYFRWPQLFPNLSKDQIISLLYQEVLKGRSTALNQNPGMYPKGELLWEGINM